jgi:hypothetical protein
MPLLVDQEQQRHEDGLSRADQTRCRPFWLPPQSSGQWCQVAICYALDVDGVALAAIATSP